MGAGVLGEKTTEIQDLELCLEKSIKEISTTMLSCESEIIPFEQVQIVPPALSAIVGFGGKISGYIAIHMSPECAYFMAGNLLGMEFHQMDDIVADAMGEMVNMMAGGMKKNMCKEEELFKISIPSIVYGSDYSTHAPKDSQRVSMGIKLASSTFSVQLVFGHI